MTRTLSVPEQLYEPGTDYFFAVDGFNAADTDWLEVRFTVVDWPAGNPLINGWLLWDGRYGQSVRISSPPRDRRGNPMLSVSLRIPVPHDANGEVAVTQGALTMSVSAAMRTAVTLTAGPLPVGTP